MGEIAATCKEGPCNPRSRLARRRQEPRWRIVVTQDETLMTAMASAAKVRWRLKRRPQPSYARTHARAHDVEADFTIKSNERGYGRSALLERAVQRCAVPTLPRRHTWHVPGSECKGGTEGSGREERDGGREASAAALSRGEGSVSDKNNEQHPHSLGAEHELADPERAGAYRLINACVNRTRASRTHKWQYVHSRNK